MLNIVSHCTNHPQVETLLSCGNCGRPYCVDCVEHTQIGTKCQACILGIDPGLTTVSATLDEPSTLAMDNIRMQFFWSMIAAIFLGFVAPIVLVFQLLGCSLFAYFKKIHSAGELLMGTMYVLAFWALLLVVLSSSAPDNVEKLSQLDVQPLPAFLTIVFAFPIWKLMFLPAQRCASHLVLAGKGAQAGFLAGTTLVALLFSWAVAIIFVVLAI